MNISESTILEIIHRVKGVCRPDKLILFGSAAIGKMAKDSDIDLLLLEKDIENPRQESIRIRRALRGLGFPFDVIVMKTTVFETTKNIIGTISYPAHKYGKVLYAET
jgi:predicted nucleotidyltransferase